MPLDAEIFGSPSGPRAPSVRDGDIFKDLPAPKEEPKVETSAKPAFDPRTVTRSDLMKMSKEERDKYYADTAKFYKENGWGTGIPKAAYDLGGKVTDLISSVSGNRSPLNPAGLQIPPEVSAAGGFVSNFAAQSIPALLSSFNLQGAQAAPVLEKPAKWLMQTAAKPSIDDLASGAADRAITTMLQEGISPTRGGMQKASNLANQLNTQVEAGIAASPARVSVDSVASRLNDVSQKALTQVNPTADVQAVQAALTEFQNSPLIRQQAALQSQFGPVPQVTGDVEIPVQLAHALKKGTYASLGRKSYGEIGGTSTESQKALARGLREEVANAVPSIVEPLKREAALMNVTDVAMNRALLESNKNPGGLATLRMDDPLSAASFMADRWAALKALIARAAYTGSLPQYYTPLGMAASTAVQPMLMQQPQGVLAK